MGKFLLEIPEDLHDVLRYKSIESKKTIHDLILDSIIAQNSKAKV